MSNYNMNLNGQGGNDSVVAQVDQTGLALRTSMRPLEFNGLASAQTTGGHYRISARSGQMTSASVTAGGTVFSFQWTAANLLAVVTRLRAFYVPNTVFTSQQEIGLQAFHASAWSAADTGGTLLTPPVRMRANMPTSQNVSGIRIPTTTIVTPGTRTVDAEPFISGGGLVNQVNAAAGTAYINPNSGGNPQYGFDFEANPSRGEYPLVLSNQEGIVIQNTVVFPAAGVAVLVVEMAWAEVVAY